MFKFEMKGMDDLFDSLDDLSAKAQRLESSGASIGQLLNPSFMKSHTNYNSVEEFFSENSIPEDEDEFEAFPQEELEKIVTLKTGFESWQEMLNTAATEYLLSEFN